MKRCDKCDFCFTDETEVCEKCGEKLSEYTGPKIVKEYVISEKEKSRRWCSAVRKLCYYAGVAMLFIAIPIAVLYGWNDRNLERMVELLLIFGVSAIVLFTLSCILESLIYIAFGSLAKKGEDEEEEI